MLIFYHRPTLSCHIFFQWRANQSVCEEQLHPIYKPRQRHACDFVGRSVVRNCPTSTIALQGHVRTALANRERQVSAYVRLEETSIWSVNLVDSTTKDVNKRPIPREGSVCNLRCSKCHSWPLDVAFPPALYSIFLSVFRMRLHTIPSVLVVLVCLLLLRLRCLSPSCVVVVSGHELQWSHPSRVSMTELTLLPHTMDLISDHQITSCWAECDSTIDVTPRQPWMPDDAACEQVMPTTVQDSSTLYSHAY